MIEQPAIMWKPTQEQHDSSRLWDFRNWVAETTGKELNDYRQIWRWSVDELSTFWDSVRRYFGVIGDNFTGPVYQADRFTTTRWYPMATVNFAENVLKYAQDQSMRDHTAILRVEEDNSTSAITWGELESKVAALAAYFRRQGIVPGDRIGAVLPNIPEALIGLLAAASVGAIWTINSPDLAPAASLARLSQLEPKILFTTDGYEFNGKWHDKVADRSEILHQLPSVVASVVVSSNLTSGPKETCETTYHQALFSDIVEKEATPEYERVPFNHPLWVLFSSGTTGAPKGIVHSHGGMLLEALKGTGLNQDMGPGDRYYVAANTSWMVWNTLVNNMAAGASVVTYSGSPMLGHKDRQFEIIQNTGVTMFATGAAYLTVVEKSGLVPSERWDLSTLRSVLSTGSPLPESTWKWVHDSVKADVHLGSDTGGTDICSGFIGSNPLEPVYLGLLQGPLLGVAVESWDENGRPVRDSMGELVVTKPMPSMPVYLWGDVDGSRYEDAYFSTFPSVWAQGDWITETSFGGFIVHGRSDATLNRQGVRIGSAEIYNAAGQVPEVQDLLVIGVELPDGGYYMPMFVTLAPGVELDETLKTKINTTIRERTSARHVPDEIIQAPGIPVNHANKRVEVPVKKIFAGFDPSTAINLDSLANPHVWDWYVAKSKEFQTSRV